MKNKKTLTFLLALILLLLISVTVSAHPGRLDSNGGHYNRSNGEYHYHNGSNSSDNSYDSDSYDYDYTTTKKTDNSSTTANYKKSAEESYKKMFGESTDKHSATNNINKNPEKNSSIKKEFIQPLIITGIITIVVVSLLLIHIIINLLKKKYPVVDEIATQYGEGIIFYIVFSLFYYTFKEIPDNKFITLSKYLDISNIKFAFLFIKICLFGYSISSLKEHFENYINNNK